MVVDEDRVVAESNPTVIIIKEFLKSVFSSGIIHFMNYSLGLPAIFSTVPLMVLILLVMLFTRYWNNKKRQYAFLIPYVAEYFGFCLYFYNRGRLMPVTAVCMTAILAVWGVLCIECFTKNAKRNVIGFLVFALVTILAYTGIWQYYEAKSKDVIKKNVAVGPKTPEEALMTETDELLTELNAVFHSKKKVTFQFSEMIKKSKNEEYYGTDRMQPYAFYLEFQEKLETVKGKWAGELFGAGVEISQKYKEFEEIQKKQ